MSRIIKFRVWHHGKMIYKSLNDILVDPSNNHVFLSGEVMQCIELQDKNGNDIYEGDILEIQGATAHVVFWEKPPEFGLNFYHNEDAWCEDWNLSDDSERMEIIGNIYEHKHLLK